MCLQWRWLHRARGHRQ